MPNERHDKHSGLADKFAALEQLPGEPPVDTHALWERLQGRLEKRPYRKIALWYWSAAACLVLAIGAAFFVTVEQPSKQTASNNKTILNKTKQPDDIINAPVVAKKAGKSNTQEKKAVAPARKQQNFHDVVGDDRLPVAEEALPLARAELQTEPTPAVQPQTIEQPSSATVLLPKKRKVVHLNEIGDSDTRTNPLSVEQPHLALHTKISPQDAILFSGNASDDIVKIKIPSN